MSRCAHRTRRIGAWCWKPLTLKTRRKSCFVSQGGLIAAEVHIWETNNTHTFEHVADIKPEGGSFEYIFDPDSLYSLTTTTGQGKGVAQPPAAKPFPFPYADDFDETPLKHTPKISLRPGRGF